MINLHYGPERMENLVSKGFVKDMISDHPFSRCMPDEVTEKIDQWFEGARTRDVVLVEEYPLTYLRYLIRGNAVASEEVHVYWHSEGGFRELRLGGQGELLDPWPTGYFDRSLEFVLGAWED